MDKLLLTVLAVFIVCFALIITVLFLVSTEPKHHVDLSFKWSILEAYVTQGSTVSLNCTVLNTDYNYSINAGFSTWLIGFNHAEPSWNSSYQQKIVNTTFNPWVMHQLQPRETRTTTLTIKVADDAPIGTYQFALQGFNNTLNLTVKPKE